jgi:hypothetical protein
MRAERQPTPEERVYPVSKLAPDGGWYNDPAHKRDASLMAEKQRQMALWATIWTPACDDIILRYIDEWGAAWPYHRDRITEEISSMLPAQAVDRKTSWRLFDYGVHRVWNGLIPGAMDRWHAAYMEVAGTTYTCRFCGEKCDAEWARDECYEIEGAAPTMCSQCGYVWTRHANDEQRRRREDLCRRLRKEHACERCGNRYRPIDNMYAFVRGLRATHVQLFLDLCVACLEECLSPAQTDKITDEHLAALKALVDLVGDIPSASTWGWERYAYEIDTPDTMRTLLRLTSALPGPESFVRQYGSIFAALVAAGVFPDGTRRMERGTLVLANDGHQCHSLAEARIDNWLTVQGIPHEREPTYPGCALRADWRLLIDLNDDRPIYVEYFGLAGNPDYDAKIRQKQTLAAQHGIHLIAILPEDDSSTKIQEFISGWRAG